MNKFEKYLKAVIRIGLGLFFIVSAILKLLSLDNFELYIYSFNLMNLTLCGLVARAIIACELLVGILLIIKVKYKFAWWLTLLMLIGFSLLLIYVILFRNDSNCHCMGDLVEIKPSMSLIKNLVGIALLMCVRKRKTTSSDTKRLRLYWHSSPHLFRLSYSSPPVIFTIFSPNPKFKISMKPPSTR